MTDLSAAIGIVEQALWRFDELRGLSMTTDWDAWKSAHKKAVSEATAVLQGAGATVKEDWQGAVVRLDGIRATSTGGLQGALQNWLRRARASEAMP